MVDIDVPPVTIHLAFLLSHYWGVALSRTYKTRPEWVKLNDPNFPTKEHHQHHRIMREPTGRMIESYYSVWTGDIFNLERKVRMVPEYRVWSEDIDCTIDMPEVPGGQHWRYNGEKLCDKRPLYRNGCPCCHSNAYAKRIYHKAQRCGINQQLRNAVRDNGWTADPEEWYDVDITSAGIADDWDIWD
jgi:hypothetical protein